VLKLKYENCDTRLTGQKRETLYQKLPEKKGLDGVAEAVELLPRKHKA
jgi:hypothetical protein